MPLTRVPTVKVLFPIAIALAGQRMDLRVRMLRSPSPRTCSRHFIITKKSRRATAHESEPHPTPTEQTQRQTPRQTDRQQTTNNDKDDNDSQTRPDEQQTTTKRHNKDGQTRPDEHKTTQARQTPRRPQTTNNSPPPPTSLFCCGWQWGSVVRYWIQPDLKSPAARRSGSIPGSGTMTRRNGSPHTHSVQWICFQRRRSSRNDRRITRKAAPD